MSVPRSQDFDPDAPTRIATGVAGSLPGGGPKGMALPLGTHLEEFELLQVLGVGGFGIVYLAQDHSLGRKVALKEFMPTSLAWRDGSSTVRPRSESDASTFELGLRSFVNEARLLARFDHASLLKVYRFWQANGTAYMVTPFYEGSTLAQAKAATSAHAAGARMPALMASIAGALQVLHGENVFHRDVAPDNIFLLNDGHPVLLDFGAARAVIGERTQSLTAILKPSFAPVEQYSQTGVLRQGPWTDLYALGGVMVYALTGQPPSTSVSRAISDDYWPLSAQVSAWSDWGVDRPFCEAVDWCLRVRPQDRPQSVAQLLGVLGGQTRVPEQATVSQFTIQAPDGRPTAANATTVPIQGAAAHASTQFFEQTQRAQAAATRTPARDEPSSSLGLDSVVRDSAFAETVLAEDLVRAEAAIARQGTTGKPKRKPVKEAQASEPADSPDPKRKTLWPFALAAAVAAAGLGWLALSGGKPTTAQANQPLEQATIAAEAASASASSAAPSASSVALAGPAAASMASAASGPGPLAAASASLPASSAAAVAAGAVIANSASSAVASSQRPLAASAAQALRAVASRAQALRASAAQAVAPVGAPPATDAPIAQPVAAPPVAASATRPVARPPQLQRDEPARAAAPLDPDTACADRILLGRQLCLSRTCRQPAYEKHADCQKLRDIEDARLQQTPR